jgi:hypothetical protein
MPELNTTILAAEPEVVQDDLATIDALIRGGPEKAAADTPEKETSDLQEAPVPTPEKEAAPAVSEVNYDQMIPITGGEPVKLGELKDAWQNRQSASLELIDRENEVLRVTEKAQLLLSYVNALPPEIAEAAQAEAARDYERETTRLHSSIPETKTPEGFRAVREKLYELVAEYGLPKQAVDTIKDATTIKMMHDFARLKASVKAARDNVKPLRADNTRAQHASTQSEIDVLMAKARQSRSGDDQLKAIDSLLRRA